MYIWTYFELLFLAQIKFDGFVLWTSQRLANQYPFSDNRCELIQISSATLSEMIHDGGSNAGWMGQRPRLEEIEY